jgi:hypothetical protein
MSFEHLLPLGAHHQADERAGAGRVPSGAQDGDRVLQHVPPPGSQRAPARPPPASDRWPSGLGLAGCTLATTASLSRPMPGSRAPGEPGNLTRRQAGRAPRGCTRPRGPCPAVRLEPRRADPRAADQPGFDAGTITRAGCARRSPGRRTESAIRGGATADRRGEHVAGACSAAPGCCDPAKLNRTVTPRCVPASAKLAESRSEAAAKTVTVAQAARSRVRWAPRCGGRPRAGSHAGTVIPITLR